MGGRIQPDFPISQITRFSNNHKERDVFTDEELSKLFPTNKQELIKIWGSFKWALFFMILKDSGMRPGELSALTVDDWSPEFSAFKVTKALKNCREIGLPKNGKERAAPASPTINKLLPKFLSGKNGEDLIFHNYAGNPIDRKAYKDIFYNALKKVRINENGDRNLKPYSLRHNLNTGLIKNKVHKPTIRLAMGHSDQRMTDNYTHLTMEEKMKLLPSYSEL